MPPVWAVNQPTNDCPVLVGVGRVPTAVPDCTVLVVGLTVPPFALKVTVEFHLAQYVVLLDGTIVEAVICVPPVWAVNQPAKVCPDLVGFAGNVPIVVPAVLINVDVAGVPPFPLKVSVTL